MAGSQGPTVKLTFAGDAAQLDKTISGVGDSSERMAGRVDGSARRIGDSFNGIGEKAGEATDTSETRFQGFSDTITGVGDTIQGFKDGSVTDMALGLADLAGGLTDFVIPTIASLGSTLFSTVVPAVWSFTTALLANPITWVVIGIVALIAAIVLMVTHWDAVKQKVTEVIGWMLVKWNDFTNWISGIASKIGGFFSHMWDGIQAGAKWAINGAIDLLNGGIYAINKLIHGVNTITGVVGIPGIPDIPYIPRLHTGGVVPGVAGSEMLTILQAGERVIPATGPQGGGGAAAVTFGGNVDGAFATAFMKLVRTGAIQVRA
ncbi:hypothetical protein ABZU76_02990 [Amycolatopsis sp. NPDC005232]|uniref:hypothetical protein n=1 Tax=Amycolatopsis sp. NPDC005232 TaxID=3157027 RepID=UPI0033B7B6AF